MIYVSTDTTQPNPFMSFHSSAANPVMSNGEAESDVETALRIVHAEKK